MPQNLERPPRLLEEAFVVHFRPVSSPSPDAVAGRIEHVGSGRAARFQSFEGMVSFMRGLLAAGEAE